MESFSLNYFLRFINSILSYSFITLIIIIIIDSHLRFIIGLNFLCSKQEMMIQLNSFIF
jgi:hypothetical protein